MKKKRNEVSLNVVRHVFYFGTRTIENVKSLEIGRSKAQLFRLRKKEQE